MGTSAFHEIRVLYHLLMTIRDALLSAVLPVKNFFNFFYFPLALPKKIWYILRRKANKVSGGCRVNRVC